MNAKSDAIRKALVIIGLGLLAGAILLLVVWQWNIHASASKSAEYVSAIRKLIPEPQGAVPEERRDNAMATLSIEGIDFVAQYTAIPQYVTYKVDGLTNTPNVRILDRTGAEVDLSSFADLSDIDIDYYVKINFRSCFYGFRET